VAKVVENILNDQMLF